MLAAEARRDRPLLERVVERRLALEEIAHTKEEGRDEFLEEQRPGSLVEPHTTTLTVPRLTPRPSLRSCRQSNGRGPPTAADPKRTPPAASAQAPRGRWHRPPRPALRSARARSRWLSGQRRRRRSPCRQRRRIGPRT